jgi:cytochrome c
MKTIMRLAVMLGAAGGLIAPPAARAQAIDGAQLFKQRCSICHKIEAGKTGSLGPNLAGVVGRKAAAVSFKYSPALINSRLVWTKPNLDRYLSAPTKMVPGTRMVISVPDAKQRSALIEFLAKIK